MSGAQGRAWASLDRDVAFLRGQRVGGDVRKDELLSCCTEEERVSGVTDQRRKPGRTSLSGEMRCKQKKKRKRKRAGSATEGCGRLPQEEEEKQERVMPWEQ